MWYSTCWLTAKDSQMQHVRCLMQQDEEKSSYRCACCPIQIFTIYSVNNWGIAQPSKVCRPLSESVSILPVDEYVIQQSLKSGFQDYEDAIQYYSAIQDSSIIGIITRNAKDFRLSKLPILEPSEWTLG